MEVSCESEEAYYAAADIVFEGIVTKRQNIDDQSENSLCWSKERGSQCGSKIATFRVERVIKGVLSPDDAPTVYAGDGCYCVDPYLDNGLRYVVYAKIDGVKSDFRSLNGCATRQINE